MSDHASKSEAEARLKILENRYEACSREIEILKNKEKDIIKELSNKVEFKYLVDRYYEKGKIDDIEKRVDSRFRNIEAKLDKINELLIEILKKLGDEKWLIFYQ